MIYSTKILYLCSTFRPLKQKYLFIQISNGRRVPRCQESHPVTTYIFSLKAQKKTQIGNNTSHAKPDFSWNWVSPVSTTSWCSTGQTRASINQANVPETFCKMAQVCISCYPEDVSWLSSEAAEGLWCPGLVCQGPLEQHPQITEQSELERAHRDQSPVLTGSSRDGAPNLGVMNTTLWALSPSQGHPLHNRQRQSRAVSPTPGVKRIFCSGSGILLLQSANPCSCSELWHSQPPLGHSPQLPPSPDRKKVLGKQQDSPVSQQPPQQALEWIKTAAKSCSKPGMSSCSTQTKTLLAPPGAEQPGESWARLLAGTSSTSRGAAQCFVNTSSCFLPRDFAEWQLVKLGYRSIHLTSSMPG